jgi:hypothetical protein
MPVQLQEVFMSIWVIYKYLRVLQVNNIFLHIMLVSNLGYFVLKSSSFNLLHFNIFALIIAYLINTNLVFSPQNAFVFAGSTANPFLLKSEYLLIF